MVAAAAALREIKARLVPEINPAFAVYDGLTFKAERFAAYLCRNNLPWPQLASGELELKDKVSRKSARCIPRWNLCASYYTPCRNCG